MSRISGTKIELKISEKLQQLIDKANSLHGKARDIIMAIYNQAIKEGFSPKDTRTIIVENVKFFSQRTVREYLPEEAKDLKKTKRSLRAPHEEDLPHLSSDNPRIPEQQAQIVGAETVQEPKELPPVVAAAYIATATTSSNESFSAGMTQEYGEQIQQLNNQVVELKQTLQDKDNEINEFKKHIDTLETQVAEKVSSDNSLPETQKQLKVKVEIATLFRQAAMLKSSNVTYVNIVIDADKYVKLEAL